MSGLSRASLYRVAIPLHTLEVKTLVRKRTELLKKAMKSYEVTHRMIGKAARVPVERTTISKNLKAVGVVARPPRQKPQRNKTTRVKRVQVCKRWIRHPKNFFRKKVATGVGAHEGLSCP